MILPVVRAVIEQDGKYLLVRNKGADFWCLPGGRVEDDEPVVDALIREMIEETGVRPEIGRLLFVQQLFRDPEVQRLEFFFEVTNASDYNVIDLNATTHGLLELDDIRFENLDVVRVLPEFLAVELPNTSSKTIFKVEHSA